jgi:hypothetical protein
MVAPGGESGSVACAIKSDVTKMRSGGRVTRWKTGHVESGEFVWCCR